MSERRFEIYEIPENHTSGPNTVTESEFKRRWNAAHLAMQKSNTPWQAALEVLLHGEGENQHDLPGCEEEAGPNWKGEGEKGDEWTPKQLAKHLKDHPEDTVVIDQPSPVPTRAEWEAWAEKIARHIGKWYANPPDMVAEITNDILSMPIIPKE